MGKYVESVLTDGEIILKEAQIPWLPLLIGPLFVMLCGFLLFPGNYADFVGISDLEAVFYISLGAGLTLAITLYSKTTELALTNQRIVIKGGWIRKLSFEIMLSRVENLEVRRGFLLGRLFNFGSITVSGVGGTLVPINHVSKPLEFKQAIENYLETLDRGN